MKSHQFSRFPMIECFSLRIWTFLHACFTVLKWAIYSEAFPRQFPSLGGAASYTKGLKKVVLVIWLHRKTGFRCFSTQVIGFWGKNIKKFRDRGPTWPGMSIFAIFAIFRAILGPYFGTPCTLCIQMVHCGTYKVLLCISDVSGFCLTPLGSLRA